MYVLSKGYVNFYFNKTFIEVIILHNIQCNRQDRALSKQYLSLKSYDILSLLFI